MTTDLKGDPTGRMRPELAVVRWAGSAIGDDLTRLIVSHEERPIAMAHAKNATGQSVASNGELGADVIRLSAGAGFAPHTHPGHHILVVIGGIGTITYAGRVYRTEAGQAYLIEGAVPHAVGAITDHVILAVGAPHKAVAATDRMALVPYEEVIAPEGDLDCTICGRSAALPARLHDMSCEHCPCAKCADVP
jgi:quercetin dioxygenase-like cupin family protein